MPDYRFAKADLKEIASRKRSKKIFDAFDRLLVASDHLEGAVTDGTIVFKGDTLHQIITCTGTNEDASARLLVLWAECLGAILVIGGLTTSQVRNIFSEIRAIQRQGFADEHARRRLILLLPKLEYAAARDNNTPGMHWLKDILSHGITEVGETAENFKRFVQFSESIIAYHRAFGGE